MSKFLGVLDEGDLRKEDLEATDLPSSKIHQYEESEVYTKENSAQEEDGAYRETEGRAY